MLRQLLTNVADVRVFGPGVLARHLGRFSSRGYWPTTLRGIGKVALRPAQSDIFCMRQVFAHSEYDLSAIPVAEARLRTAYQHILDSGARPVIVDCGANIGAAALWYARHYPDAQIVAVEPEDGNYALLQENVRSFPSIVPVQAAIGGTAGCVKVHTDGLGWVAQTTRSDSGLPVLTIADCVKLVAGGRLFGVKVDIEGFEDDLFAGGTDWLADAAMVAIEPHDWMHPGRFTSRNFMKTVAAHEFEVFIRGENLVFVR